MTMRRRWRVFLPALGLILFAVLSFHAISWNSAFHRGQSRYFWWSSVRLDSDPLNKHPKVRIACQDGIEDCGSWDPEYIWITPGWIERVLVLSALPAFLASMAVVYGLGRLGVSQVVTFMISMPLFIIAWFYLIGWPLDRWQHRRSLRTH